MRTRLQGVWMINRISACLLLEGPLTGFSPVNSPVKASYQSQTWLALMDEGDVHREFSGLFDELLGSIQGSTTQSVSQDRR